MFIHDKMTELEYIATQMHYYLYNPPKTESEKIESRLLFSIYFILKKEKERNERSTKNTVGV